MKKKMIILTAVIVPVLIIMGFDIFRGKVDHYWEKGGAKDNVAGQVKQINNKPPFVTFTISNVNWTNKVFNASGSYDPEGIPLEFAWDTNDDGTIDTVFNAANKIYNAFYTTLGSNNAVLYVRDQYVTNTVTKLCIRSNCAPIASFFISNVNWTNKRFIATNSRDPDDTLLYYAWDVDGDGIIDIPFTTNAIASNIYQTLGSNNVVLIVKDRFDYSNAVSNICTRNNILPVMAFSITNVNWTNKIFDASATFDPDGGTLEYAWDFDGFPGIDTPWNSVYKKYTNYYSTLGSNEVILYVRDGFGTNVITNICWRTNAPPIASFTISNANQTNKVFNASGSYDPDGTIIGYAWDLDGDGAIDTGFSTNYKVFTNIYTTLGSNFVMLYVIDHFVTNNASNFCWRTNALPIPSFWISNVNQTNKIFYATNTKDNDDAILLYAWDTDGDGLQDTGFSTNNKIYSHYFNTIGSNYIVLYVCDKFVTNVISNYCWRTNNSPIPSFWISNVNQTNKIFYATNTKDNDDAVLFYAWDTDGDGLQDTGFSTNNWTYTNYYTTLGSNFVVLYVCDPFITNTVGNICWRTNFAPTIGITSPTNGQIVLSNFIITVNASDPENGLAKVEFYDGTVYLGSVTNAPYSFSCSNVHEGIHIINAVAVDNFSIATTNSISIITYEQIAVATNGDDSNAGLKSAPIKSIQHAIDLALQFGVHDIYIGGGVYTRGNGLLMGSDGVSISNQNNISFTGGWNDTFSIRQDISELNGGFLGQRIISVSGATNIKFDGFLICGGDKSNDNGGGVIFSNCSYCIITNCTISNNRNGWGAGMAIISSSNNSINAEICYNTAATLYGGLYIKLSSSNNIGGMIHHNYGATAAGGVRFDFGNNNVISAVIATNYTTGDGGGILAWKATNLTIIGDIISNYGAGIHLNSCSNVSIQCVVSNNCAPDYGGGIDIYLCKSVAINGTICNNIAPSGGGISVSGSTKTTVIGKIINNIAGIAGAGVWVVTSDNVSIINALLTNNGPVSVIDLNDSVTSLVVSNCTIGGAAATGTFYGIREANTDIAGHTISNNIFLTKTLGYLYYDYTNGLIHLDEIELLNTSGNSKHDAIVVGGNTISPTISFSNTNEFYSIADCSVSSLWPNSNYNIAYLYNYARDSGHLYRSFVRFDFSSLSSNVTISSAIMKLCVISVDGMEVGLLQRARVVSNNTWAETEPTWINQPVCDGADCGSCEIPSAGNWISIDVTTYVRSAIALDKQASFSLIEYNNFRPAGKLNYYSKENGSSANNPRLVITYGE